MLERHGFGARRQQHVQAKQTAALLICGMIVGATVGRGRVPMIRHVPDVLMKLHGRGFKGLRETVDRAA